MAALKIEQVPDTTTLPDGPDGPWTLWMSAGRCGYAAASLTDLVCVLIEDYPVEGTDQDRLISRARAASRFAATVQGARIAERSALGAYEPHGMSRDEVSIAFEDKSSAVSTEGKWRNKEVPLVLVASHYEPYTCLAKPTGNVAYIDPFTELTLLESLRGCGLIELYEL